MIDKKINELKKLGFLYLEGNKEYWVKLVYKQNMFFLIKGNSMEDNIYFIKKIDKKEAYSLIKKYFLNI